MKLASTAILGLLVAASLYAGRAEAACDYFVSSGITTIGGENGEILGVVADASLPNGSVFRTVSTNPGEGSPIFNCDRRYDNVEIKSYVATAAGAETTDTIRELYLQDGTATGIGLRFRFTDNDGSTYFLPRTTTTTLLPTPVGQSNWTWNSSVQIEYIKLSDDIRYGQVRGDRLAQTELMTSGVLTPGTYRFIRRIRIGGLRFVSPTCSIDTGELSQEVKLGHYSVDDFQNQPESPWMPFYFTVTSCANPLERFADITFGGGSDADPNNNALFSMNAGGPKGLGIAIRTADGTNAAMAPGATRAFADPIANKQYAFEARLERTVGDVTPGTIDRQVNVRITFR